MAACAGAVGAGRNMMIRPCLLAAFLVATAPALAQAPEAAAQVEAPETSEGLDDPCAGMEDCGDVPDPGLAGSGESPVGVEAVLLSDYRFRGISRSDEDPALQAALTVFPGGGVYAGVRGTTLK